MKIVINPELCLNKRFIMAKCTACAEICPTKSINEKQEIDDNCINCGLCLAKCPVEAIGGASYSEKSIQQLIAKEQPVRLICHKAQSDSRWPCLGFLDPILLLSLVFSSKDSNREVVIYHENCMACNSAIAEHIVWAIEEANRLLGSGKKRITSSAKKFSGALTQESSRRQFLAQLWGASLSTVRNITFPEGEGISSIQRRDLFISYGGVRMLPKTVCNQTTFKTLVIGESCNACGICAKMCGQGAITSAVEGKSLEIRHNSVLCNNCGICVSQCPQGAVSIIPANSLVEVTKQRVNIPVCTDCGKIFRPLGSASICLDCMQKTKVLPL